MTISRRNVLVKFLSTFVLAPVTFLGKAAIAGDDKRKVVKSTNDISSGENNSISNNSQYSIPNNLNNNNCCGYVTPEMFGAYPITTKGYENKDSTLAIQLAIDYAKDNNIPELILNGLYRVKPNNVNVFFTPTDDGTVSPKWLSQGDSDILPEIEYKIPFALRVHSGFKISGRNINTCGFAGEWDCFNDDIKPDSGGCLFISSGSKSSTVTVFLENFSIKNFFIGELTEGINFKSKLNLKFVHCGFSGIEQGRENCFTENLDIHECYVGFVVGGWWLHRNRVQSATLYLPPYPAADCYLSGWCDADENINVNFSVAVSKWGQRHILIDKFFDDYFYKSKNSELTKLGGRSSNNTVAYNQAEFSRYPGVSSRALAFFSRYGRNISNCTVRKIKTYGTHRFPVFGEMLNLCFVDNAYIERSGYIDPSKKAGDFGKEDGIDYLTTTQEGREVGGFILGEQVFFVSSSPANTHPVNGFYKTLKSQEGNVSDKVDSSAYAETQYFYPSHAGANLNKVIEAVSLYNYDEKVMKSIYVKRFDYFMTPPILFSDSDNKNKALFSYFSDYCTPSIFAGDYFIGKGKGKVQRMGGVVKYWLDFLWHPKTVNISNKQASLIIKNLPFSSIDKVVDLRVLSSPTNIEGGGGVILNESVYLKKRNGSEDVILSDFSVEHEVRLSLSIEYPIDEDYVSC